MERLRHDIINLWTWKTTIIKYLKEKEEVRNITKVFCDLHASHLEMTEAGIRLILLLYGAK